MALSEKLNEALAGLQPRERKLLLVFALVMPLLAIFAVTMLINSSFDAQRAEIQQYRDALYYLEDNQAAYSANKLEKDALLEKLIDNDMQVGDFLRTAATGAGIPAIDVSPGEERDASSDGGGGAKVTEYEVTIKTVERDNLLEFLWKIDQLDAPVFIRRLAIRRNRSGRSDSPETPLTVSMTVASYKIET